MNLKHKSIIEKCETHGQYQDTAEMFYFDAFLSKGSLCAVTIFETRYTYVVYRLRSSIINRKSNNGRESNN
jgi:hypothetical protein